MGVSDTNSPARQPGVDRPGQDIYNGAVATTGNAADGDASSGEMTARERNKRDGLAGTEGKDSKSLLMDLLNDAEEILVQLQEHLNLRDGLDE